MGNCKICGRPWSDNVNENGDHSIACSIASEVPLEFRERVRQRVLWVIQGVQYKANFGPAFGLASDFLTLRKKQSILAQPYIHWPMEEVRLLPPAPPEYIKENSIAMLIWDEYIAQVDQDTAWQNVWKKNKSITFSQVRQWYDKFLGKPTAPNYAAEYEKQAAGANLERMTVNFADPIYKIVAGELKEIYVAAMDGRWIGRRTYKKIQLFNENNGQLIESVNLVCCSNGQITLKKSFPVKDGNTIRIAIWK